nr:GGDEF domain-containing protein [Stenotrophomonas koreensis]
MRRLADTDGLTGLPNRRVGLQRLNQLITQAGTTGVLSIGFVDVDHFKAINDTYGHDVGDKVLVEVARVMAESVRADDVVRMGGEEFLVMLPGVDLAGARARMQAIGEQLAQIQLRSSAPGLLVTASIGIAQYHPGDMDMAALLRRADQAMYGAKQQGRNQVFEA